jgi:hypothetical protein
MICSWLRAPKDEMTEDRKEPRSRTASPHLHLNHCTVVSDKERQEHELSTKYDHLISEQQSQIIEFIRYVH